MSKDCMSIPPVPLVPVDDAFFEMLTFAVRYALGRRTYAAGDTARYVEQHISYLDIATLSVIESDIAGSRSLGDPCDEEAWRRCLALVRKEKKRRCASDKNING